MDRHYWQGLDFWVEALSTWAVLDEVLVTEGELEVLDEGGTSRQRGWIPGDGWGAEEEAVAARLSARVPFLWDRPRIVLDLDGEALLRVEGRAVLGVNPTHRFVDLTDKASREPVALVLELSRVGVMGRRFDDPRIRRVALQRIDPTIAAAALDLEVLAEWGRHPLTPPSHREEVQTRLRAALAPVTGLPADLDAWEGWLRRTGGGADDEALYQAIIKRRGPPVDGLRALETRVRTRAAHDTAGRLLALRRWMAERYPKSPGQLLAVGHAHIDWAWLWRVRDTRAKVVRTVASQLTLLERFPEWVYGMSSPMMWQALDEDEPEVAARATRFARAGRIEPLGAFWVEADGQLPQAGAYLRHLQYTLQAFKARAGDVAPLAFLPDTFGFAAPLPTLLAAAGVRLFLTTKINWNDTTVFPYKDFWWVGPDGSRVQAHIFGRSSWGYNGLATLDNIREAWNRYEEEGGRREVLYTFGLGDGGGGPDPHQIERLLRYRDLPDMPAIRFGRPESLMVRDDDDLPVYRGELYLEFHRGIFTTQTRVKRETRRLESRLMAVEAWDAWLDRVGSIAWQDAWTTLLATHFHDILPGSSIGAVYRDWEVDHTAVEAVTDGGVSATVAYFQDAWADAGDGLLVLNPSDVRAPAGLHAIMTEGDVDLVVEGEVVSGQRTHDGALLFRLPEIPALGAASFALRPGAALRVTAPRQEALVEVGHHHGTCILGPEGIRSLTFEGRELLEGPAGVRTFYNHPAVFDAWEIEAAYRDHSAPLTHSPPVVVEEGPLRTVVHLQHAVGASSITELVAVDRTSGQVSSALTAVVHDRHLLIRYEVPTTLRAEYAVAETIFGTVLRPTVPAGPQDAARFEWAAHRFVDLAEPQMGLALINDGRYGHSVDGGRLGLTVSTSPLYPDPDADVTPAPLRVLLMPHEGDFRRGGVLAAAHAFSLPLEVQGAQVRGSKRVCPLEGLPDNVEILGFKRSQDGLAYMLYLGEVYGQSVQTAIRLPFSVKAAARADLVTEAPRTDAAGVEMTDDRQVIRVAFAPRSLAILRVEPDRQA